MPAPKVSFVRRLDCILLATCIYTLIKTQLECKLIMKADIGIVYKNDFVFIDYTFCGLDM